jgi:hypothetical protein
LRDHPPRWSPRPYRPIPSVRGVGFCRSVSVRSHWNLDSPRGRECSVAVDDEEHDPMRLPKARRRAILASRAARPDPVVLLPAAGRACWRLSASDTSVSKLLRSPVPRSDGDTARIAWRMSHTRDVGRSTLLPYPTLFEPVTLEGTAMRHPSRRSVYGRGEGNKLCVQARPSLLPPTLRSCDIRKGATVPLHCVSLARSCLLLAAVAPRLGLVDFLRRHAVRGWVGKLRRSKNRRQAVSDAEAEADPVCRRKERKGSVTIQVDVQKHENVIPRLPHVM